VKWPMSDVLIFSPKILMSDTDTDVTELNFSIRACLGHSVIAVGSKGSRDHGFTIATRSTVYIVPLFYSFYSF